MKSKIKLSFLVVLSVCLNSSLGAQDLTSGLVSIWEFDSATGYTATDSYGNNDGDLNGGIVSESGKINNAYSFSGGYVNVGDLTCSPITLSCWINPDQLTDASLFHHFFEIYLSVISGKIRWGIYDGTSFGNFAWSSTSLTTGDWYHVVATWDGSSITKVFINGILEGTGNSNSNHYGNDGWRDYTYIGRRTDMQAGEFFGLIDQPAIWNRELSSEEIALLFNNGYGLPYTTWNLVTKYWIKDETGIYNLNQGNIGIGTSIPDKELTVNGTILSKEVIVDLDVPAPDYVFDETYNLRSTLELEEFVKKHHHLPEIPRGKDMEMNGINLSNLNMLLLKKIEELTLYIIEQENRIKKLESLASPQNNKK